MCCEYSKRNLPDKFQNISKESGKISDKRRTFFPANCGKMFRAGNVFRHTPFPFRMPVNNHVF